MFLNKWMRNEGELNKIFFHFPNFLTNKTENSLLESHRNQTIFFPHFQHYLTNRYKL
jgi:hypothetical protein